MCGIVGVITKRTNGFINTGIDIFAEMLTVDSIRGPDSTGVFMVNKVGNVQYAKVASHPFHLLKSSKWSEIKGKTYSKGKVLVGHNRKATVGMINNESAHPFVFGSTILVHNGNIENFRSLLHHREREKYGVEVDSHAACVLLARNNPEDIIPEMHGAFTFAWYSGKDKTMNFIRNDLRPLAFCNAKDEIYFASEKGTLAWLLRRREIREEITELKPGLLIKYKIEDDTWEDKEIKLYSSPKFNGFPHNQGKDSGPLPPPQRDPEFDAKVRQMLRLPPPAENEVQVPRGNVVQLPKVKDKFFQNLPPNKRFNIHYGDKLVKDVGGVAFPQIVWVPIDYKQISNPQAQGIPVWQVWGNSLLNEDILVDCNIQADEDSIVELAEADALCCIIGKVVDNISPSSGAVTQRIFGRYPRKVEIVQASNGVPIIDKHKDYLCKTGTCQCGHKCEQYDDKDKHILRDGFAHDVKCSWCVQSDADEAAKLVEAQQ